MISKLNEKGLLDAAQAWDTDKSNTIIDGLKAAIQAYLPHHDAWLPIEEAPRDGTAIDAYFELDGKNVLTRTYWITKASRWNGMVKGQEPLGFQYLPTPPKGTDE